MLICHLHCSEGKSLSHLGTEEERAEWMATCEGLPAEKASFRVYPEEEEAAALSARG